MSLKVRQVTARSRSWHFERPLGVLRFQNRRAANGSARPRTIRLRAPQPRRWPGPHRDGGALCQTCVDLAVASPDFCPRNNVRHAMPCLSRGSAMTDEYRAKAEYCRQMADQVLSPLDKETWLQLAWDWSTLASVRERSARTRNGRLSWQSR